MVIDGKKIAQELRNQLKQRVDLLGLQPLLCDVLVGSDPVSLSFVRTKQKAAETIGIKFNLVRLPETATNEEVIQAINIAQQDQNLCGLIVQLPLPKNLDSDLILSAINLEVDVDLLNPQSAKNFYSNQSKLIPPTAAAVVHILDSLKLALSKENIMVLGQGNLVGKPVSHLLEQRELKINSADINTPNTPELLHNATVIITGVGRSNLVTAEQVQNNVVIIDAGTSESGGAISGDVEFASVEAKARFITPVPGGVGPVTVAKLLENVVLVAEQKLIK